VKTCVPGADASATVYVGIADEDVQFDAGAPIVPTAVPPPCSDNENDAGEYEDEADGRAPRTDCCLPAVRAVCTLTPARTPDVESASHGTDRTSTACVPAGIVLGVVAGVGVGVGVAVGVGVGVAPALGAVVGVVRGTVRAVPPDPLHAASAAARPSGTSRTMPGRTASAARPTRTNNEPKTTPIGAAAYLSMS
jgi:hypothetical protein